MTFEEARAQFPVLERYAYLNAGTNGPLARSTAAAAIDAVEQDAREGRSGTEWIDRLLALREEARRGLAAVIGVEPELLALTDSTSRGCAIVVSGLDITPEDEIVTTDQEHFGLIGSVHASGARVVVCKAVATPGHFAAASYEPSGAFEPKPGATRFDAGFTAAPALAGLVAALETHPEWRYERAAATAAQCRELLEEIVDVVTPPGHSTLVSFRPPGDPTELVTKLHEDGVIVRELPGRNLVRASVGWWTSEDDLERLAAGLRG